MDPTALQQLITLLQGRHWLGLAILITVYLRKLASADSKFPISIPAPWLPVVSAAGGLAYGFEVSLQSGASFGAAAMSALVIAASTGFFDGLMTAIFSHQQAPAWAKFIVGLVDDITGSAGPGGSASPGSSAGAPPVPPSPNDTLTESKPTLTKRIRFVSVGAGAAAMLTGCAQLKAAVPEFLIIDNKIIADLKTGDGDVQIVNDVETIIFGATVTPTEVMIEEASDIVLNVLNDLLATGILAREYPALIGQATTIQGALVVKKAARKH